jgi:pimeloyl-ACP methyl ester carboxylesterase
MAYIKTNSTTKTNAINIFYQEYGIGKPVIFIHGWPLNHEMWEYQINELPNHKMRCIAYDRRGFGKSDRPWEGYDYNTMADDLNEIIIQLNLTQVTLVGFSMGGGEIARYIAKYGNDKIDKVVFISSVTPFRLKTEENPDGIETEKFNETINEIIADRPAFLTDFGKRFYGVDMLSQPVSKSLLAWNQTLCLNSAAKATIDCVRAFSETDFRDDLLKINVPVLIIHGDNDNIVPIQLSGDKTAALIPHATYNIYANAPHGLFITDRDKLNKDLIGFINS